VPLNSLDGVSMTETKEQNIEDTGYELRVVTQMSSKKKPRRAGWLCGTPSDSNVVSRKYKQQHQSPVALPDKPQDTTTAAGPLELPAAAPQEKALGTSI